MEQNFFDYHINGLKEKYSVFSNYQDYHLFSILCIKYFFYSEGNNPFDPDLIEEILTDGANDGGIDAVFNDPNSENNDLVVVQSKFYKNTPLHAEDVIGELYKINETLKQLKNNKISSYNEKLVTAYRNATSQMEDDAVTRIVFFTSFQPKNKREKNKLEKNINTIFKDYDVELNFAQDIETQIEICDNGKLFVDYDKINIDRKDNYLEYNDSVIVNISALSLQDLQNRRRNGLLGMNLRYYVKQKAVDDGIKRTIEKEPESFWYKNNGILIICDDFEIDGKTLKLWNFSIINGGQTTNRIGNIDIDHDFYLQCKVIKALGESQTERDRFALAIAEATNSQKPIKKADLKANTVEQLRLRELLAKYHVYYITKKGDKPPKQFDDKTEVATLEQVGKIGLASILQMPGSARSNSQRMYQDEYYYPIFGEETKGGVIADCLRISHYYDVFLKTSIKDQGYDEKTVLPIMKNGKTYQLACISLLCKLHNNVFAYESIAGLFNNADEIKIVLKTMGDMDSLIKVKHDNEEEIFKKIFSIIGEEVLGYCFGNAVEKAEEEQRTIAASDYLKSDNNYYKDVIKRLWSVYKKKNELRECISLICEGK